MRSARATDLAYLAVPAPGEVEDGLVKDVVDDDEGPLEVGRPDREAAVARAQGHAHEHVRGALLAHQISVG